MIAGLVGLVALVVLVRRRSNGDDEHDETTDHVRSRGTRANPFNLPMPESPHVHRPLGSIDYDMHTTLGHAPGAHPLLAHAHPASSIAAPMFEATVAGVAPAHADGSRPIARAFHVAHQETVPPSVSAAFGRVNASDHESPTVAYGARGYAAPAYVPPPYINQPYVHEPYVQQRARSFPPVPTFEPSSAEDDGPTTFDPSAQTRAEQTHFEIARGSSPSGWQKK
jgi:hypothetical protein